MRIKDEFRAESLDTARRIVRAHPFATIVTRTLQATHMPCLLEEEGHGLTILGHVARADPVSRDLDGPLLLIFHGPHGYVSGSWYGEETIPTWNNVTLHVRATPQLYADPMPVLRRTVDHFEAAVEQPWSLDRLGETARELAGRVVAFRLEATDWHAELKLSQDKPAEELSRVLAGLETPGPYRNPPLAAAMKNAQSRGSSQQPPAVHP